MGCEAEVTATRPGLLLDPYFSATKVAWILDNVGRGADRLRRQASCVLARLTVSCCGG